MFTEARISATKPTMRATIEPLSTRRDADREQRADDDDRGDRVGDRHQRRMQRRRHRPDDVVADEDREHEDREAEDEGIDRAAGGGVAGGGELVGIGLRGVRGLLRRRPRRPSVWRRWRRDCPSAISSAPSGARSASGRLGLEVRMDDRAVARQQVALTISSSQLTASALSVLSISVSTKARGCARRARRRSPRGGVDVGVADDLARRCRSRRSRRLAPARNCRRARPRGRRSPSPAASSATISAVTRRGAGRPGISAVVMTMSCLAMCEATSAACLAL